MGKNLIAINITPNWKRITCDDCTKKTTCDEVKDHDFLWCDKQDLKESK